MVFIWIPLGALLLASLGVAGLIYGGLRISGRRPQRYWQRTGWAFLVLLPLFAFVVTPYLIAHLAEGRIGTRSDERSYAGPRIDPENGSWMYQSRKQLRAEQDDPSLRPAHLTLAAADRVVRFTSRDGVALRGWWVPAVAAKPPGEGSTKPVVVLVHGLFRSALELERPASIFRDFGHDVFLLEMRNHGGSSRARTTFGRDEALDVLAAVAAARERRPGAVVLYGVSLGAAAVALALPELTDVAAVVLDAPTDDMLSTAHRMLDLKPVPGRRRLKIYQPWRSLVLTAIEWRFGIDLAAIDPSAGLRSLPPQVPVLLIGEEEDQRMPPSVVRSVFDALSTAEGRKLLWICPGADHGSAFETDFDGYREQIAKLLALSR